MTAAGERPRGAEADPARAAGLAALAPAAPAPASHPGDEDVGSGGLIAEWGSAVVLPPEAPALVRRPFQPLLGEGTGSA